MARKWGGTVTCVDSFCGNINGGTSVDRPDMIGDTAAAMVRLGVSAQIRLIPALTVDAAQFWREPIDFLYVDADHSYASVRDDLAAWWPRLRIGGLIAGDDYRSSLYPGLERAWDEFEVEHGQAFERVETPNTNPPGMALIYGVKR